MFLLFFKVDLKSSLASSEMPLPDPVDTYIGANALL